MADLIDYVLTNHSHREEKVHFNVITFNYAIHQQLEEQEMDVLGWL
jgi:hypothetical protein